jgi:hypothetical protein
MEEANPISSHYLDGDFLPYSVAESTSIESSSISGLSSMSEASLPNPCDYLSFNVDNAEEEKISDLVDLYSSSLFITQLNHAKYSEQLFSNVNEDRDGLEVFEVESEADALAGEHFFENEKRNIDSVESDLNNTADSSLGGDMNSQEMQNIVSCDDSKTMDDNVSLEMFLRFISDYSCAVSMKHFVPKTTLSELLRGYSIAAEEYFGKASCIKSTYFLEKPFNIFWKENVKLYALCSICGAAHKVLGRDTKMKCSSSKFLNYRNVICGNALCDEANGLAKVPFYCFPLQSLLKNFLQSEGFMDYMKYGIERIASSSKDIMDIYDGSVCQSMYKEECLNYLSGTIDYMPIYLMFNSDGFVTSERNQKSLWGFNFSFINLPRSMRFKKEYTMVWTIVHAYTFGFDGILDVLVDELKALNEGFVVDGQKFKVKMIMSCCDLPASRKMLGFVAHNATIPCSFCKHIFPRFEIPNSSAGENFSSKPNFCGLDYKNSGAKSHNELKESAKSYKCAPTQKMRDAIEKDFGYTHSPFIDLNYLDIINVQTIDGMHLFGMFL